MSVAQDVERVQNASMAMYLWDLLGAEIQKHQGRPEYRQLVVLSEGRVLVDAFAHGLAALGARVGQPAKLPTSPVS